MDFLKKNQNAEGPDSDIDGNRVDIMFFKILLVCQKT